PTDANADGCRRCMPAGNSPRMSRHLLLVVRHDQPPSTICPLASVAPFAQTDRVTAEVAVSVGFAPDLPILRFSHVPTYTQCSEMTASYSGCVMSWRCLEKRESPYLSHTAKPCHEFCGQIRIFD